MFAMLHGRKLNVPGFQVPLLPAALLSVGLGPPASAPVILLQVPPGAGLLVVVVVAAVVVVVLVAV